MGKEHHIPASLSTPDLHPSPDHPCYLQVTRDNITFTMPATLENSLKKWWVGGYKKGARPTVKAWYEQLPLTEKKLILINGKSPNYQEEGTDPE